jgi:hypothetical protein
LRGGGELVAIDGVEVALAVERRLALFFDRESDLAKSWAVRTLLAGRQDQERLVLTVANEDREIRDYAFECGWRPPADNLLTHRVEANGNHTIRIENSLGNFGLVAEFDAAMDKALGSKVLTLDLTNTPGGGNSLVARALLGRFVSQLTPYQRHEIDEGPLDIPRVWVEQVTPRGSAPYRGRLLVLANHWTGSMGEGLTLGLDTLPNSTVIGTRMAGLKGATESYTLPHSGIRMFFPTERLSHVEGYARESFYPDVMVESDPDKTSSERIQQAVTGLLEAETQRDMWLKEVPNWIATTGHQLASVEPSFEDNADLAWLDQRTEGVKVFAMGEATHGNSELFRVRHRLTRYLIENAGFNVVAFESSAARARACDRFILGEDISIKEAMGGLGMAIWQIEELRDLLVYLRQINTEREEPIRFFGVDMQDPGSSVRLM